MRRESRSEGSESQTSKVLYRICEKVKRKRLRFDFFSPLFFMKTRSLRLFDIFTVIISLLQRELGKELLRSFRVVKLVTLNASHLHLLNSSHSIEFLDRYLSESVDSFHELYFSLDRVGVLLNYTFFGIALDKRNQLLLLVLPIRLWVVEMVLRPRFEHLEGRSASRWFHRYVTLHHVSSLFV